MADIVKSQGESVPTSMRSRYRDMGDGTHALVVSAGGALTDGELRASPVPVALDVEASGLKVVEGRLRVSATPYLYDIAEGVVAAHSPWSKIGYNADVDNAQETIWTVGGMYAFPAVPMRMEIVSGSANDTAGGSGVRTVQIGYLDAHWAAQTETVTMNGAGAVGTLAVDIRRVNSFRAATCGAGARAAGIITLRGFGGGATYSQIALGQTRARNSVYTVPVHRRLFVTSLVVSSATGTTSPQYCIFTLYANWDDAMGALGFMQPQAEIVTQEQAFMREFEVPLLLPERTDLYVAAMGEGGQSSLIVSSACRGWLEDM